MHTAESISNFVIEYLGEIETELENALACLSGAQMGSNYEKKTGGQKSRDTLPLNKSCFLVCNFFVYEKRFFKMYID